MRSDNWDILEEDYQDDDDVQYVGVVEEDDDDEIPQVVEPAPVRQRSAPAKNNGANNGTVKFETPTGSYLSLNREAQQAFRKSPTMEVNGKPVRRLAPGTYAMLSHEPGVGQINPSGFENKGMGVDAWDLLQAGGEWLIEEGPKVVGKVAETVGQVRAAREEREAEAARLAAEAEAAAVEAAVQEANLIRQQISTGTAQVSPFALQLLRAQQQQAAAAPRRLPKWAWIALGVGGVTAAGIGVWAIVRKR
jgi:Xaa-Pro aminopeptidase